ncbi:MAG: hypothetical protein FJX65_17585 [Alphaproteobacteria bacterium]|nr:hypothetical protein [Alphaproteobacteria bacterium]
MRERRGQQLKAALRAGRAHARELSQGAALRRRAHHVSGGDRPVVVDTTLGKLGITICYDLIFPEYIQRLVELGANVVINSTNWINDSYQRDTWAWGGERTTGLVAMRASENVIVVVTHQNGDVRRDESVGERFGDGLVVGVVPRGARDRQHRRVQMLGRRSRRVLRRFDVGHAPGSGSHGATVADATRPKF